MSITGQDYRDYMVFTNETKSMYILVADLLLYLLQNLLWKEK